MITKEGNAIFRTALSGAKYLGKNFGSLIKKPFQMAATPVVNQTGFKGVGKEFLSQTAWGAPFAALGIGSGVSSVGGTLGGNLTGILTSRAIAPLTNRIANPVARKAVHFTGSMAGDIAGDIAFTKWAPIWRRQQPDTNVQPNISKMNN